jgi:hypothetical protein
VAVIGSMKVVTSSERRTRPELVQPGDREWVTGIQSVYTARSCTPLLSSTKGASTSLRGTRRLEYRVIGSSQCLRMAGQIIR